jgi:vacuolar-type H+-ATPase subunit E/Vma4
MAEPSEKLYEEVMADAKTKAERAQRRAAKESDELRQKTAEEAQAASQSLLAAAQAEAEAKRAQTLATVDIEMQRERLSRLEVELQKVFDLATAELGRLDGARLRESLLLLALEGLSQMPPQAEVELALRVDQHGSLGPQLVADVVAQAPQKLGRAASVRLAGRPADIPDGLVLRTLDGRAEVVDSFRERLRRLWPELRLQAAAALFPESARPDEER